MNEQKNPKKIRILHCGDIHLDSAFSQSSIRQGDQRRAALRAVFSDMMKYVKNSDIDILLIAGDLFDSEFATTDTLELLVREFSSVHIPIVISPGNHDPYNEKSIYSLEKFPSNVYVFSKEELSSVHIPNLNTTIYGWAFSSPCHTFSPLAAKRVKDKTALNLICAHAQLDSPLCDKCPVTKSDIEAFGADYAAFGHIHVNPEQKTAGTAMYAYSGCLEGRSFDESGVGGAWLVEAEKKEDGYAVSAKRLSFGRFRYETVSLDISGISSHSKIHQMVLREIERLGLSAGSSLRVILNGAVPLSFSSLGIDENKFGLDYIEYKDRTTPTYDADYLKNDMTIKGELYRYLLPKLTSGTNEERENAIRALKIGLAALDNREFTTQAEV